MLKPIFKLLLLHCFVLAGSTMLSAQTDSTGRMARLLSKFVREDRPPDKPRFLVYPTLGYAPETSLEVGVGAALLFHAKNKIAENRLSEITSFAFVTLRSQYGAWIEHAVYSDQERWFLSGRARFQRFPLLYYGVGTDTGPENPDVVDGVYAQLRQRIFHQVRGNFFAGTQVDYQALNRVVFGEDDMPVRPLPSGADGSSNLGLGVGVAYDTRPNALNTREGWYAELGLLRYDQAIGSDFEFTNYNADIRWYRTVRPQQVLAVQFVGNIVAGDAPFNQLSLLGGETIMRGYYTGRYRDRQLYALQTEYRFLPLPFSKRIGAVAFVGAGTVAPRFSAVDINNVRLAGGAGLRFLLFPKKDIFLRFDLGFTREGPGFYIFTGEAF